MIRDYWDKWFGKSARKGEGFTEFREYANATVQISDTVNQWGRNPKADALLKRFLACSEASTPAMLKAMYCSQNVPRMYKRGDSTKSRKSFGADFRIKQSRVTKSSKLAHLKNRSDVTGVGSVASFADGSYPVYEVYEHPFLSLLARPNRFESGQVHRAGNFLQREIFGNAYTLALKGEDGYPGELRTLYGQHVRIGADEDEIVGDYIYQVGANQPEGYSKDEIAHWKYLPSMTDYYYGTSWMERAVPDIDILINAKAVELNRLNKGMRADLLFLMPEGNPVQRKQVRQEIDKHSRGARNSGGYLLGDGISGAVNLNLSSRDMEYSIGMERAARSVRNAAGIPEAMSNLNQSNLASALQADGQFRQVLIQPLLCSDAEQLTELLIKWYGHEPGEYWLAYDAIVDINAEEKAKTARSNFQANGILLNEFRAELDLNPLSDERGEKLYSELAAAQAMPGVAGEEPLTPVNQPKKDETPPAKPLAASEEEEAETPPATAPKSNAPTKAKAQTERVSVKSMTCCGVRGKSGDEWEYNFSEASYRLLKGNVADWYSKGAETGRFDAARLLEALQPLETLFQEGGQDGVAGVLAQPSGAEAVASAGVSFDVLTPESVEFIDNYKIRLSETLSAEKQAELQTAIRDGVVAGDNTADATAKVQAAMTDRTEDEAERIARTEANRTYQMGNLKAWKDSGVEGKKWELAGGPCPLCEAIAEKYEDAIAIDTAFFKVGDELVSGKKTYVFDYEDIFAAPAHPACRCVVTPVLRLEQGQGEGE